MDAGKRSETNPMKNTTTAERKSERELVVTRTINAPAHIVYEAWTKAELFRQWWVPKSFGLNLVACEMDVRTGGKYRLAFNHQGSTMEFFGKYLEVVPNARIVWTNDEGDEAGPVTTVTFDEQNGRTHLVVSDLYPSKEALDAAMESGGSMSAMPETLDQLEALLLTPANSQQS